MKIYKLIMRHKITTYRRCLFLGIILMLFSTVNVKAEPDYGKEIIMVSMGDSYSSGEGIPPFYGPWSIEKKVKDEDWLAHRSKKSWPGQLRLSGLDKGMEKYKVDLKKKKSQKNTGKWYFVASSGALTKDIFDEEQNKPYNRTIGEYVYKNDQNPLPKQAEIFDSITKDEVDYITLSLGGNDVGFSDIVKSCAMNVPYSEQNGLPNLLDQAWKKFSEGPDAVEKKLTEVYEKLWEKVEKSHGNIIVAGYPQLVAMEGGNTLGVFGFDQIEAAAVNISVSAFNDKIEKTVLDVQKNKQANIYFVSVEDAFIDHGAYEDEPYINQIIIPSTKEDLEDGTSSAFSIHPNEKGAEVYAACVQDTIDWIEAGKPDISVSGQVINKNNQPVGNLTVVIKTEKARKEVFRGTTNDNGEFSGEIKLINQNLRIIVSNEEKQLIDTPVIRHIEYGNNYLGKIKLDNDENKHVSEPNEQLLIDEDNTKTMYEKTIAEYDKMMHEGQLSYRENNRDTYEEADRYTYYTIVDIDGNGVDELILRFDHQDASHWTNQDSGYGESTYIYTVKDGVVVNVVMPESSVQGFAPDFIHLGFTKVYKGTNLINRGMYHLPQDDRFYRYQDGIIEETPVLEITRGGGTWLINNEEKSAEECIEAYNTAANNDVGYELQLYERETNTHEQASNIDNLIEQYKNFIKSKNNSLFYSIYDIEKDGYPELFFYENHPQERESFCDIYFYSEDGFKLLERTYGPGFWHVLPTYASYPNGNGLVEYGAVKGREFVDIVTWDEGVRRTETVYNSEVSEEGTKYYKDTSDDAYDSKYVGEFNNHQYYESESSSPYFEGSYLLGQSAIDNFTALYEAFDFVEEKNSETSNVESDFEKRWMLVKTVLEGVDGNKVGLSRSDEIVTEYIYDENHNCIEEKESHDGGASGTTNTYGYDDEGNLIYMETPTGGPYLYTYNDLGQEIQCEEAGEIYTSSYDDHGNIVQRDYYRNGSIYHFIRYIYDYDDGGNAVVKQCVDDDGIVWVQECEYDINHNLIKVEHYARGEEYSWMETYEYDDTSHKVAVFQYSKDNEIVMHHTFEYDQFGNLAKEYDIRDGQVYSIKTYYYEQY